MGAPLRLRPSGVSGCCAPPLSFTTLRLVHGSANPAAVQGFWHGRAVSDWTSGQEDCQTGVSVLLAGCCGAQCQRLSRASSTSPVSSAPESAPSAPGAIGTSYGDAKQASPRRERRMPCLNAVMARPEPARRRRLCQVAQPRTVSSTEGGESQLHDAGHEQDDKNECRDVHCESEEYRKIVLGHQIVDGEESNRREGCTRQRRSHPEV